MIQNLIGVISQNNLISTVDTVSFYVELFISMSMTHEPLHSSYYRYHIALHLIKTYLFDNRNLGWQVSCLLIFCLNQIFR